MGLHPPTCFQHVPQALGVYLPWRKAEALIPSDKIAHPFSKRSLPEQVDFPCSSIAYDHIECASDRLNRDKLVILTQQPICLFLQGSLELLRIS